MQIDTSLAPTIQLNSFIKNTSSLGLTAPAQIIGGQMAIQFSADGQQLSGTVTFFGNGYIQPGSSLYQAQFTGSFIQSYTGLAEA